MNQQQIKTFEDLECWQACRELRVFVARSFCKALPKDEKYRLCEQALRSARSTTANIAEGYGRFHYLDNAKFCSNARGSCHETLDHMITAGDEDLVPDELIEQGRQITSRAIALLNGYISYLRKSAKAKPVHEGGLA
ncbi:MAG TPA: four helix bundle protein [Luteolibacter sp.]|nr:four helix bundle protein [Luteolibacter sp.]